MRSASCSPTQRSAANCGQTLAGTHPRSARFRPSRFHLSRRLVIRRAAIFLRWVRSPISLPLSPSCPSPTESLQRRFGASESMLLKRTAWYAGALRAAADRPVGVQVEVLAPIRRNRHLETRLLAGRARRTRRSPPRHCVPRTSCRPGLHAWFARSGLRSQPPKNCYGPSDQCASQSTPQNNVAADASWLRSSSDSDRHWSIPSGPNLSLRPTPAIPRPE